jgi:hypothetical protein
VSREGTTMQTATGGSAGSAVVTAIAGLLQSAEGVMPHPSYVFAHGCPAPPSSYSLAVMGQALKRSSRE